MTAFLDALYENPNNRKGGKRTRGWLLSGPAERNKSRLPPVETHPRIIISAPGQATLMKYSNPLIVWSCSNSMICNTYQNTFHFAWVSAQLAYSRFWWEVNRRSPKGRMFVMNILLESLMYASYRDVLVHVVKLPGLLLQCVHTHFQSGCGCANHRSIPNCIPNSALFCSASFMRKHADYILLPSRLIATRLE